MPSMTILCFRVQYVGEVPVYCPNVNCVTKVEAPYLPPLHWQVSREMWDHSLCLSSPLQVMGQVCSIKAGRPARVGNCLTLPVAHLWVHGPHLQTWQDVLCMTGRRCLVHSKPRNGFRREPRADREPSPWPAWNLRAQVPVLEEGICSLAGWN